MRRAIVIAVVIVAVAAGGWWFLKDKLGPTDPYLWLEDIHGDKSLAWVKDQNARTLKVLTSDPRLRQGLHGRPFRSRRHRPHSLRRARTPIRVQLLARQGASERHLAAHHHRRLRQSRSALGNAARRRQAGGRRKGRLGLQGTRLFAVADPLPDLAVARRRRCGDHPRIRSRHEDIRQRRLQARRSEVLCLLRRRQHGHLRHQFRRRHDDRFGLSAHREVVDARRPDRQRQARVRRQTERRHRRSPGVPHERRRPSDHRRRRELLRRGLLHRQSRRHDDQSRSAAGCGAAGRA